ncbi:hypothetical protein MPSEU_000899600 [Mayamaea pseudoterrestris]|nr:hypothetical protein MPSEU_000899600 [Mayamaea pseudoterrestris]
MDPHVSEGRQDSSSEDSSHDSSQGTGCTSRCSLACPTIIPKALPDLDDVAMSHVFQYIQQSEQDLFWSFLSDSFFILGGGLYIIIAIWDASQQPPQTLLYILLNIMAPLVYLLNSIVDVEWAYRVKKRLGTRRAVTETWNDWRLLLDGDDECTTDGQEGGDSGCTVWYQRLRKHSAHRRTIVSAITFGIAAVFGLLAVLMEYRNERLASASDSISVNVYILSAVLSCSGKRTRPWLQTSSFYIMDDPERLEDFGDLLFLVGSLVDGFISILQLDEHDPRWDVFSSALWCIDACFYLRSDFIMYGRLHRQHLEGSALV